MEFVDKYKNIEYNISLSFKRYLVSIFGFVPVIFVKYLNIIRGQNINKETVILHM